VREPGKVLLNLALAVACGQPSVCGRVARLGQAAHMAQRPVATAPSCAGRVSCGWWGRPAGRTAGPWNSGVAVDPLTRV